MHGVLLIPGSICAPPHITERPQISNQIEALIRCSRRRSAMSIAQRYQLKAKTCNNGEPVQFRRIH